MPRTVIEDIPSVIEDVSSIVLFEGLFSKDMLFHLNLYVLLDVFYFYKAQKEIEKHK